MSLTNLYTWNNSLSGYFKLGLIDTARKLFDRLAHKDVISWNTMIIGYAQSGEYCEALRLYREFRKTSLDYNEFSFAGVLTVGVKLRDPMLTRQVHCQVFVVGFLPCMVISSSIIDGYAKCGDMVSARKLFGEMRVRDVTTWTTLIAGYAKWGDMKSAQELFDIMPERNAMCWTSLVSGYNRNNLGISALDVFRKMMMFRIRPDQFTFSSCLCACGRITSLKHGKQVHAYMIRTCFRPNTIVMSSLIDMYSKCGSLNLSEHVFSSIDVKKDVMLWNPMMGALAQHGHGNEAIKTFDDMILSGTKPNRVTFVILLSACSHSGLVNKGLAFFKSMSKEYGVPPDEEHYACLIDLLGRGGRIDELLEHLEKMPCKNNDRIWNALVGVCRIQGNVELGKEAAQRLIEMNPLMSAPYLLLASVYAACENWERVERMRRVMDERSVRKEQARSWVETNNKV